MRALPVLLTACALGSPGCSVIVRESGQDLSRLTTRAQVHASFGVPVATGLADGRLVEEYTTRRKIAEPVDGIYLVMGYAGTLGLGEFVWFPHALYTAGRRSVVGQHLRFTNDDAENVTAIHLDGDPVRLRSRPTLVEGPEGQDPPRPEVLQTERREGPSSPLSNK